MEKSSNIKKSGNIMSAYPQDNAGNQPLPDTTGGKFGGSVTNLSHSIKGANAQQEKVK